VFGTLRDHMTDAAARRADAEAVAAAAAGAGHPECAATTEELDARMRAQSPLPREVPSKYRFTLSGAQADKAATVCLAYRRCPK
jgi:hypothetical protein